ncbi:MAG: chemotaxis protein CheW [Oligoflexia bacterium]|nr:chemotaxis protein CheW [Oligoflexia bacterium]
MTEEKNTNKEDIKVFVDEILTNMVDIENLLVNINDPEVFNAENDIATLFRYFHNIKGVSAMFEWESTKEIFHMAENLLSFYREKNTKPSQESVDVLLQALDFFKSFSDKLLKAEMDANAVNKRPYKLLCALDVVLTNALAGNDSGTNETNKKNEDAEDDKKKDVNESIRITGTQAAKLMEIVSDFIQLQNRIIPELTSHNDSLGMINDIKRFSNHLQNFVLSIRLSPLRPLLSSLNRIINTTARDLKKKVHLKILGGDTQLDRKMIEMLREPLIHMVRNSIDHGIEVPAIRKEGRKSEYGIIVIEASQQSGQVVIVMTDDGKGIDPKGILNKALENKLIKEEDASKLSQKEILKMVFLPGFSTAKEVTDVSGRGVGMDAVKTTIESLGGTVEISSEIGMGTKVILTLPLTLAIIKSLSFLVGKQIYAIPQVSVEEVVTRDALYSNKEVSILENGQEVIHRRKLVIPIVALDKLFNVKEKNKSAVYIIVKYRGDRFALKVHSIVGTNDFVSQPSPKIFSKIDIINGVSQLNSGEYIGLLDLSRIADLIESKISSNQRNLYNEHDSTVSDVFRSQQKMTFIESGRPFAIPVQSITEVFEMSAEKINYLNDRAYITYREKTLPLLRIDRIFGEKRLEKSDRYKMLLLTYDNMQAVIACSKFHGIQRLPREFDDALKSDIIMGTITNDDETYLVPNIRNVFTIDFPEKFSKKIKLTEKSKFTVLVVEDDRYFAANLGDFLANNDINYHICVDGLEAKEFLAKMYIAKETIPGIEIVNYIIADYEMPRMNGLELLRWIRLTNEVKHLPLSICTAVGDAAVRSEAENLGIDTYAEKVRYDQFIQIILAHKKKFDLGIDVPAGNKKISDEKNSDIENSRILTFLIENKYYGIAIDYIKEISGSFLATEVPGMIKPASQMISFRGNPVAVIDLRRFNSNINNTVSASGATTMVNSARELSSRPEQIVAQFGTHTCALWVDKVCNVKRVNTMDRATGIARSTFGTLSSLLEDIMWDKNKDCVAVIGPRKVELLIEKIINKTNRIGMGFEKESEVNINNGNNASNDNNANNTNNSDNAKITNNKKIA